MAERNEEKLIKEILGKELPLVVNWAMIDILDDWAFADVAEKDAAGDFVASMSALLRRHGDTWKVVAKGSPLDPEWEEYKQQMPSDIQEMFDQWKASLL